MPYMKPEGSLLCLQGPTLYFVVCLMMAYHLRNMCTVLAGCLWLMNCEWKCCEVDELRHTTEISM
jgi:hypothetical protein